MDIKKLAPYFDGSEKWGDVNKVQWFHLHHLYLINVELNRMGYNWKMNIHCSYEKSGHSTNSWHYKGYATDFHFITDVPLQRQYLTLLKALDNLNLSDFCALGVYPEWNNKGFHLDSRGSKVRWVQKGGKYIYSEKTIDEVLEKYK